MQMFIDGWYEKLPDYEFMLWDFNRFDIHSSQWVKKHLVKRNMPLQQIIYDYMRYIIMVVYTWIWMLRF